MEAVSVTLSVNGKEVTATIDPRTLLIHFLREQLHLTGTHMGCDTSQCGACTVHLDGEPIKSCAIFAAQLEGAEVTTIEGVARDARGAYDARDARGAHDTRDARGAHDARDAQDGEAGRLHPMQAAFKEHHGLQCGFCTPGMVMMGIAIANRQVARDARGTQDAPSEATIRRALEGNLCRCTGYHNIVKSIAAGARAMRG